MLDKVKAKIKEHPVAAVLIAFGAGALLASFVEAKTGAISKAKGAIAGLPVVGPVAAKVL